MYDVLKEDVSSLSKMTELFDGLRESTILVTGASGLLGSLIVKGVLDYNTKHDGRIKVVALAHGRAKAEKIFSEYVDEDQLQIVCQDITEPLNMDEDIDYIIHAACPTASRYFVSNPVETDQTIFYGTENILEFAAKQKVSGMVFLSSLEVYGTPFYGNDDVKNIKENDYGVIDPLDVRSSYSEGKRMAENLCASYASEYGLPVKIIRLTQTFGPGIPYNDGRVFAEFARCAVEGNDIVLHTKGETIRNYCYTVDAAAAILLLLLKGNAGEAYNAANQSTKISIREMAERFAKISDSNIRVIVKDDADKSMGYNPIMKVELNSSKLMKLGWRPIYGLDEMFSRLYDYMKGAK